jgi:hypothetical protein
MNVEVMFYMNGAVGRERPVKSKKETLKKRITNIEQGKKNIEVRYSIIIIFEKD